MNNVKEFIKEFFCWHKYELWVNYDPMIGSASMKICKRCSKRKNFWMTSRFMKFNGDPKIDNLKYEIIYIGEIKVD